ncbi:MAG: phosphocarrier protein HPr [Pseudonocardiales bacterium]|jgi:phosphocarrier protein HPr|nr:phosphocarrier protein HPr [Pseudonocardiales bacterium]
MTTRTVTVASKVGLHARPAATFTRAAAGAGLPVTIAVPGKPPVNAASVLAVMTLGVEHGQEVILAAEGDGADTALDTLVELLATDLDA